jgi:tetratricopeptide (TPR) repeat protein
VRELERAAGDPAAAATAPDRDAAMAAAALAALHAERGRCELAVAHARHAEAAYEALSPDHPRIADPLLVIGRCALAAGDLAAARAAFTRAVALRSLGGSDPARADEARAWLAKAR